MSLPASLSTTLGGSSQLSVRLRSQREQPPLCLSLPLGTELCLASAQGGGEDSESQGALWGDKAAGGYFLTCPSFLPAPPQVLPVRCSQDLRAEMRAISGFSYDLTSHRS